MRDLIGKAVAIPELFEEGIVCGFNEESETFVIETEYGWLNDVKRSQLEMITAHKAPQEQNQQNYAETIL